MMNTYIGIGLGTGRVKFLFVAATDTILAENM